MLSYKPATARTFFTVLSGAAVLGIAGGLLLSSPASAQQPAQAPAQAPAKKPAEGETANASSWVKLCEDQKHKQKQGDQVVEKKINLCLTHHERFHPTTGQPLISAAIRKLAGDAQQESLMIMVPLGRLIKPGLAFVIDDNKPVQLEYAYCTALGCVAETLVKPELVESLKKGKELQIRTIDVGRKKIGFKIPLAGFTRAYDGDPIDREVYAKARKQMFDVIRARQVELVKRAKAAAEKKKAEGGAPAPKKPQ